MRLKLSRNDWLEYASKAGILARAWLRRAGPGSSGHCRELAQYLSAIAAMDGKARRLREALPP
jgi:hypothetical protein